MTAEQKIEFLGSINNLLEKTELYQVKKGKEVDPRLHSRLGPKRNVEYYILCFPSDGKSVEIILSGNKVNFAHAKFFINDFGKPQVIPIDHTLATDDLFEELVYDAIEILANKEFLDEDDFYYNPYLDGYYIHRRNPGEDGLKTIQKAVSEGVISQEFADKMIKHKFTLIERFPNYEAIERRNKKRKAKKKKKELTLV